MTHYSDVSFLIKYAVYSSEYFNFPQRINGLVRAGKYRWPKNGNVSDGWWRNLNRIRTFYICWTKSHAYKTQTFMSSFLLYAIAASIRREISTQAFRSWLLKAKALDLSLVTLCGRRSTGVGFSMSFFGFLMLIPIPKCLLLTYNVRDSPN
jgi:hypothetical protein